MQLIENIYSVADGTKLTVWHTPIRPLPWIISVHGIAEHSARHHYLLPLLQDHYNLLFFDLRGHGKSEGKRGDIKYFDLYRQDLIEIIHWAKQSLSMTDYSLHAHSMGALITASFIQQGCIRDFLPSAVFLSAPPAGAPGLLGPISDALPSVFFSRVAKCVHGISGRMLIDNRYLSHNPQVEKDFAADHLNLKDPSLALVLEIAATYKIVFSKRLNCSCRFLCVIGTDDRLVTNKNLANYFATIEPQLKFKLIEGGYHEMHNEVPKIRQELFNYLSEFFKSESPRA